MTKVSWVLAATEHGPMIVNRHDRQISADGRSGFGVGFQLLERGVFDPAVGEALVALLRLRRAARGEPTVTIDGGANVGAFTLPLARACEGWGSVHAFEPQERVYHALCGTIALNNLRNAHAYLGALGASHGALLEVPRLDFDRDGSFGSLSLVGRSEDVGQLPTEAVDMVFTHTIDASFVGRLDLVKLDLEGMELDALRGAVEAVERERPILFVEHTKSDREALRAWMVERRYVVMEDGMNLLGVHEDDPCRERVRVG